MSDEGQQSNRLQAYVKQLTPQARSRLLVELERLHLTSEDIPGSDRLLAALRAEFRKGGRADDRVFNPSRYFFQPLEPVLVNTPSADTHAGQISRTSLLAIWDWIGQALLPTMAREYETKIKPAVLGDRRQEAEKIAATFQSKVEKCLDGVFADATAIERTRNELGKFTASTTAMRDVEKILRLFRAKDALAKFRAALPKHVDVFKGQALAEMRLGLDTLRKGHPDAVPFALQMAVGRLREPWQLIRLATQDGRGKKVSDVAAAPYTAAFAVALGVLNDRRMKLLEELRQNHVLAAREILVTVYDLEDAIRGHIGSFATSDWEEQLDRLMAMIRTEIDAELHKLPDNLHHVLASSALHRQRLVDRVTAMMWRLRDAASGLMTGPSVRSPQGLVEPVQQSHAGHDR